MELLNSTLPEIRKSSDSSFLLRSVPDFSREEEVKSIKIGVYDGRRRLIGYKSDTFWCLSKDQPKKHLLAEDGEIPAILLENLSYAIAAADSHRELKAERLFIGYECFETGSDDQPIITHLIERGLIRELKPTGK